MGFLCRIFLYEERGIFIICKKISHEIEGERDAVFRHFDEPIRWLAYFPELTVQTTYMVAGYDYRVDFKRNI